MNLHEIQAHKQAQLNRQAEQAARDLAASFGFDTDDEPETPPSRVAPTARQSRKGDVARIVEALRAAGPRGQRSDRLDSALRVKSVQRVNDARDEGWIIDSEADPEGTAMTVYVLRHPTRGTPRPKTQIRIDTPETITGDQVDALKAHLIAESARWLASHGVR